MSLRFAPFLLSPWLVVLPACGPDEGDPSEGEEEARDPAAALAAALDGDVLAGHLEALQALADENEEDPGVRPAQGTRDWARALLEDAGWQVEEQAFGGDWVRIGCPRPCSGANLIATWPEEPGGRALLVGGHLDVVNGPGINDNGTGIAAAVEIAVQAADSGLADEVPLRLALFDREESGLIGSMAYVSGDDFADGPPPLNGVEPGPVVDELLGLVNIDMIGSSNGVPGFKPVSEPASSSTLTDAAEEFFAQDERTMVEFATDSQGGSDHQILASAGLPVVWLFAGGSDLKTEDEAARYGGVAGEPYEACYHAPCDNFGNVDSALTTDLARAAAWAVGRVAGRDTLAD